MTRAFNFIFKLNLMIIGLEHKVGRVMVPLNQADKCNHIFLSMGRPLVVPLSCILSVPPTREGYGRALPWAGKADITLWTCCCCSTLYPFGTIYLP